MNNILYTIKTSRKAQIILGLVILLIFALLLLLIFSNRSAPKAVVVADTTPVNLIWQRPRNTSSNYSEILSSFRAIPGNEQVNIRIVEKDFDDNYYKDLLVDFAKEKGPDIFSFNNQDFWAAQEWLTPITNIPGTPDSKLLADYKSNFTDLVVKDSVYLDKIYAVSSYVDTIQMYYNKNLLEQAGIPLPPPTWDDLQKQLAVLNKINTDKTFRQSAISLGTGFIDNTKETQKDQNIVNFQDIIPLLIFQNKGQLYDLQSKSVTFGSNIQGGSTDTQNPTNLALQFYLSFADPQNIRYSWNTSSKNNVDSFLEGKVAYILNYSSFQNEIEKRQNRIRYGITEVPQISKDSNNKKTFGKYFMDGISRKLELDTQNYPSDYSKTKKLQKAREFLNYLTTKEAQKQFLAKSSLPAARKDLIAEQQSGDEKIRIFAAGSLYADSYYKPNNALNNEMWGNLIYRIQFENKSLKESLATAVSEYGLTVQKGPVLDI